MVLCYEEDLNSSHGRIIYRPDPGGHRKGAPVVIKGIPLAASCLPSATNNSLFSLRVLDIRCLKYIFDTKNGEFHTLANDEFAGVLSFNAKIDGMYTEGQTHIVDKRSIFIAGHLGRRIVKLAEFYEFPRTNVSGQVYQCDNDLSHEFLYTDQLLEL